jgi:hypothetical protein
MSFPSFKPLAAAVLLGAASLQVPGFAELTSPTPGEAVSGLVTLRGTADHPAFQRFEVSFAYAQDPTDTWFPIGEPVETRVIDGRLALWDTTGITDGDYSLRLLVRLEDGRSLEARVAGVRVRNYSAEQAAPTASAPEPVRPLSTPTALPPVLSSSPSSPQSSSPESAVRSPFWTGAAVGAAALAAVGAYSLAAPAARAYLAHLRTRQLHRRLDRSRSRGGRS